MNAANKTLSNFSREPLREEIKRIELLNKTKRALRLINEGKQKGIAQCLKIIDQEKKYYEREFGGATEEVKEFVGYNTLQNELNLLKLKFKELLNGIDK